MVGHVQYTMHCLVVNRLNEFWQFITGLIGTDRDKKGLLTSLYFFSVFPEVMLCYTPTTALPEGVPA